jgi:hypothetical protein
MDTNDKRRAVDAERLPAEELEWVEPKSLGDLLMPKAQRDAILARDAAPAVDAAQALPVGSAKIEQWEADLIGKPVEASMDGKTWRAGTLVEIIDLFVPYRVELAVGEIRTFAEIRPAPITALPAELDKLKALAEAATPGPWERGHEGHGSELAVYCDDVLGSSVCEMTSKHNMTSREQRIANLDFIAAANPAAILRIAALVAQQAARIEGLQQDLNDARNGWEGAAQAVPGEVGEIEVLRNGQSARVMPLIGPMLDALDGLPNDTREALKDEARTLFKHLTAIRSAVEDDGAEPRKGGFQLTRSIIHECPALRLPQSFLEKLGNAAQIVVLKGANDKIAKFITDACNAQDFSTQESK